MNKTIGLLSALIALSASGVSAEPMPSPIPVSDLDFNEWFSLSVDVDGDTTNDYTLGYGNGGALIVGEGSNDIFVENVVDFTALSYPVGAAVSGAGTNSSLAFFNSYLGTGLHYFGLRFEREGQYHLGWIELILPEPTAGWLVRGGWESTPETGIGAGVGSSFVAPDRGPWSGGNLLLVSATTNGNLGDGLDITNLVVDGTASTNITAQGTNWVAFLAPPGTETNPVDVVVQSAGVGSTTLFDSYAYNPKGRIGGTVYGPTAWTNLADGVNDAVNALVCTGPTLYAGGDFTTAGGVGANHVAMWNGTDWTNLGAGMNASVSALAYDGSNLYAGGWFTNADGQPANYVAMWNGSDWSPLGAGLAEAVMALAHDGTNLYAGCNDGAVAMWDGVSWTNYSGIHSTVWALLVDGSNLYAGSSQSDYVHRWNGTGWSGLGNGMDSQVNALAQDGTNLYAGGWFSEADEISASAVAMWDGGAWTNLGSGLSGGGPAVMALAHDGTNLYAGGWFTNAGSVAVNSVASWTGTTWTNLGSGLNGFVMTLARDGANLYAGGAFTNSVGLSVNRVAKWGPSLIETDGVAPGSGSWTGGYEVVITGTNLGNGSDITNVTLCGVSVASITSQSATQIVVVADASDTADLGDVRVFSTIFGETVKSNAFEYMRSPQAALEFEPVTPQANGTTNALSVSGGSGTGAVSYAVLSGPGAIVGSTNLVVTNGSGTVVIRAIKAEDSQYMETSVTGSVIAAKGAAGVYLADLAQTYNGTARSASATSDPAGLTVEFTYDGHAWAPTNTGSYAVTGTVNDANWQGSSTGTLVVSRAVDHFVFSETNQVYTGAACPVTVQSSNGQIVVVTYNGSTNAPVNVGIYTVTGVVNALNWTGTNDTLLTISRASQTITFPTLGKQRVTNAVGLSAMASSGLPVTFSVVSGPGVITGGTNLTFTDRGEVDVEAEQSGDDNWNGTAVTQVVEVSSASVYLDFDGDGRADIAVFWPEAGMWYILQSSVNTGRFQAWGWTNSVPTPADYDGDGQTDVAVYSAEAGTWYIWQSASQTNRIQAWGYENAWPVPGDYDGDGIWDLAVYTPESGMWSIWQSATQTARFQAWGFEDAEPVPADYDGDGMTDLAVYAPESGTWLIWQSATQTARSQAWGWSEAWPIPGDYDGDGLTDVCVYEAATGFWLAWLSASQTMMSEHWGWSEALPVPADYDGDAKFDRTVYAPSYGMWYLWQSATQTMRTQAWGFEQAEPVR